MSSTDKTTQSEIVAAIFESDEAFETIQRFIESLASQGVLKLFICEDGLKKLTEKLIEEKALHDQYADLGKSSISITTRYVYYYAQHLARTIFENGVGLLEDVSVWVKPLIEIDNDPVYAVHLFNTLAGYAMSVKSVYVQAVDYHFSKMKEEFEHSKMNTAKRRSYWNKVVAQRAEYSLLIEQAFPAGLKDAYKAKVWRSKKTNTFLRVNFGPVIESVPFKDVEKTFSESDDQVFKTRKAIYEVESDVLNRFKNLILEDVLEYIEKNGLRKTSNVMNEVICKLNDERPAYVNMRFVQAFYEFYREDYAKRQRQFADAMFPGNPEFSNNGRWGNIVIPN